ncbi:MAG: phage major capsid protein [Chloroflexi bacterium]|nr:MAG: phage major capsid protein [Chloroflexota bacterium]
MAQSDAIAQGTGLVGDFANFAGLVFRSEISIQVGYINDDFKLGKQSIRADVRVALPVYRAAAFCTVTGL